MRTYKITAVRRNTEYATLVIGAKDIVEAAQKAKNLRDSHFVWENNSRGEFAVLSVSSDGEANPC